MNFARQIFTIFFFFLIINCLFSRQQQQKPGYRLLYEKAEKLYHLENPTELQDSLALDTYLQVIGTHTMQPDHILWESYYKAGILIQTKGDFQRAIPYLKKTIDLGKSIPAITDSMKYLPNLYLGNSYYSLSMLDSAVYYYRVAEQVAARVPAVEGLERLYNTMGAVNYESGDYLQSSRYFEKALQVVLLKKTQNDALVVNYKNNIASSLRQLKQYQAAMNIFQQLLKYNIDRDKLMHNIGSLYLEMNQPQQSIVWLKKSGYETQGTCNDLATAYLELEMEDSAVSYLHRANTLNKKNEGRKNVAQAVTLKLLGDIFEMHSELDSALQYYQQSIIQLVAPFDEKNIRINPEAFNGQFFVIELFEALVAKARTINKRAIKNNNEEDLRSCIDAYRSVYRLTDYVARNYETEDARFFLNDRKHLTHSEPIDAAIRLYRQTGNRIYLEQAFEFDEKNKAGILALQIQQRRAELLTSLPAELIQQEQKLKQQINRIILDNENSGKDKNGGPLETLNNLQIQLASLQKRFDQYPEYKKARFIDNTVSVERLQQFMPENAAVLSYHLGDSSLLCFLITKKTFEYFTSPVNHLFTTSLHRWYLEIQKINDANQVEISRKSKNLYNILIAPFEKKIQGIEQLMIIPDDELSLVPFQLLRDQNDELLVSHHTLTYNYSCTILQQLTSSHKKENDRILAMAPYSDAILQGLPASKQEIAEIAGTRITGADATKKSFISQSGKYNIIHLATHAYANDSLPLASYISFYPGSNSVLETRLYAPEITELSLKNAWLIILSACETATGPLVKGEGLMSLTRAFSAAGCPNTIASLWKADDIATSAICKSLHQQLKKGKTPARALQLASLDYLDDNKIPAGRKTPAHWAHLRLVGSFAEEQTNILKWLIIAAATLLITGIIIYFSRKASST